ncbi:unnamed protein product [Cyclocybe aegerita]|uniref:Uncharacterized protein n=1 Tax=Cyclocybe aegerita TaxID=1973307 RepID=A0A8S0WG20_CYCAE|nr:unnamed protein product [Cyclocybe aegerita]
MTATIHQALCRTWWWDTMEEHQITFHEDGTGEIVSKADFRIWISASIEWSYVNPSQAEEKVQQAALVEPAPRAFLSPAAPSETIVVAEIPIEFRITKAHIPRLLEVTRELSTMMNDGVLFDSAFQKRTLTLTLKTGEFITQWHEERYTDAPKAHKDKYRLTLLFSESPYPGPDEWKYEVTRAPKQVRQWEMTRFCAIHIASNRSSVCIIT